MVRITPGFADDARRNRNGTENAPADPYTPTSKSLR